MYIASDMSFGQSMIIFFETKKSAKVLNREECSRVYRKHESVHETKEVCTSRVNMEQRMLLTVQMFHEIIGLNSILNEDTGLIILGICLHNWFNGLAMSYGFGHRRRR